MKEKRVAKVSLLLRERKSIKELAWKKSLLLAAGLLSASFLVGGTAVFADNSTNNNAPEAADNSAMNSVQGFLSYTGWYRPEKIHFGGTDWENTSSSDWRPYLMYTWPDLSTQLAYEKYFIANGYGGNGLTTDMVTKLQTASASAGVQQSADVIATKLRDNIEAKIKADGDSGVGNLSNTMNAFAATQPAFSYLSEQPLEFSSSKKYTPAASGYADADQFTFINNAITPSANSDYRLMNKAALNQLDGSSNSELLLGDDIDNSNPAVQAETMNWEYYLLHFGDLMSNNSNADFDGFRIDATNNVDNDILNQEGQLLDDLYGTKESNKAADEHLTYNETYSGNAVKYQNQDSVNNQQLTMDAGFHSTLIASLKNGGDLTKIASAGDVTRTSDSTYDTATPNWSFVNNHDMRLNDINHIMIAQNPGDSNIMGSSGPGAYNKDAEQKAIATFEADEKTTNKKYAMENIPSAYALELTNKDTVPEVYYGDLYDEFSPYMSQKSIYYPALSTILSARKSYVAGGQAMSSPVSGVETSVRYGMGNKTASYTSAAGKTSGIAVVVSNKADLAAQTIKVAMGADHANQEFKNIINTTPTGITTTDSTVPHLKTDDKGNLMVPVKGYSNPQVIGDLSVWVPADAPTNQDVTSQPSTSNDSGHIFQSNSALDSHVIFEDFSEFEPGIGWNPGSANYDAEVGNDPYTTLASNASKLQQMGFTDIWMAPPYKQFGMGRMKEGYAIADRYDLGISAPTKYGNSVEMQEAIEAIHDAGMKAQVDLVPNQVMGLDQQEAVTVNRTDNTGNPDSSSLLSYLGGKNSLKNIVYFAYTKGGGDYQKQYGGKFLADLDSKYPDLFNTPAVSNGKNLPTDQPITEWSAKYENGTSLQNIGVGLAMKASDGTYDYINSDGNSTMNTQLPKELTDNYAVQNLTGLQEISGKYYDFDANGQLLFGQQTINGKNYLFNQKTGVMLTGFQTISNKGVNIEVYYNSKGQMQYGQQTINKQKYLFDSKTGAMKTGFQKIVVSGKTITVYYNSKGIMVYGQQTINKQKYLFDSKTGAMQTGFKKIVVSGKTITVYYNSKGIMLHGQQTINKQKYLFDSKTGAMKTGFQKIVVSGKTITVYYDSKGHMLFGKHKINGKIYNFKSGTGALVA